MISLMLRSGKTLWKYIHCNKKLIYQIIYTYISLHFLAHTNVNGVKSSNICIEYRYNNDYFEGEKKGPSISVVCYYNNSIFNIVEMLYQIYLIFI